MMEHGFYAAFALCHLIFWREFFIRIKGYHDLYSVDYERKGAFFRI